MINKIIELAKNNLKISDFHLRGGSDIACRVMGEIVIEKNLNPQAKSGQQEMLENILNKYL